MTYMAGSQDRAVVFRCTDDNVVLRGELREDILMAGAVLQGQQVGIRADDAPVAA